MASINADDRSRCFRCYFFWQFISVMRKDIAARNAECGHRVNDCAAAEDFFHVLVHLCHLIRKI